MDVNEVHIVGRAGKDAERKGDRGPVKFTLATGGGKKKDSEEKWPTHWHTAIAWGELRDRSILVRKGQKVEIWGRLEYNDWEDKQGLKHHDAQVVLKDLQFDMVPEVTQREMVPAESKSQGITDDDIPF